MEIRPKIKEQLLHDCKDTFLDLEKSLINLGELDRYLLMNSSQSLLSASSNGHTIQVNQNIEYNSQLLTQEIFDDFGAALNCFLVGYFKQAQSLLRNAVELTVQIWKNKYDAETGNLNSSAWVKGIRGIEKIEDACANIESFEVNIVGIAKNIRKINKLYSNLCKSTHSHKGRTNILNAPRINSTLQGGSFEPLEFLYTKRIFYYTLQSVLESLSLLFKNQYQTDWNTAIYEVIDDEINRIEENYRVQNQNYIKGFIIFRESLTINASKTVELYSIDLEKNFSEPTKRKTKLNDAENKLFWQKLEHRFLHGK